MNLKTFFDYKVLSLLFSMLLLIVIMTRMSPLGTLDTRFFYTNAEALQFLSTLSAEGIMNYRLVEYLDLFFIYKYSRTLFLSFERLVPEWPQARWLALLPGVFDVVETGTIIAALHSETFAIVMPGLGLVTAIKWTLATVAVTLVFIKLGQLIVASARKT